MIADDMIQASLRKGGYLPKAHLKLVIFHKGRRIEKPVADKRKLVEAYRKLKATDGVKVAVVSVVRAYWPDIDYEIQDGMWWCPYCRKPRYFSVPRFKPGADVMSEQFYLNYQSRNRIRICQWCRISEDDFHVRRMNRLTGHEEARRRRGKRKPLTRRT